MSGPATPGEAQLWQRLPERLQPLAAEPRGSRRTWLIETVVLVVVGLFLTVATVNDLARQTHINSRLTADLLTWRSYTGHDYRNLSVSQELLGAGSQHEVVCGNTSPGAPKTKTQLCLAIWGPVVHGRRTVHGGWYLRAYVQDDVRSERYGCFGPASAGICAR
jgi:hypothetical protein